MKFLVDTDYLFGIVVSSDPHHREAKRIAGNMRSHSLYISNLVLYEIATVLSYKANHQVAKKFIENSKYEELTLICIDTILEAKARDIFFKQTKKGTSFVDCANLAAIAHYKLDGILSFDAFYPKTVRRNG